MVEHRSEGLSEQPLVQAFLKVLGPPRLYRDAIRINLPERAFCLLAYLCLQPGHAAKRETVRALLWGDSEPAKANDNLRQLLSRFRRAQAETGIRLVRFEGDDLQLETEGNAIDLVAFNAADPLLLLNGRQSEPLRAWLDLYGGDLLANLTATIGPFDDWLPTRREQLRERFLAVAGTALEAGNLFGDDEVLSLAQRVRALEPASEQACRAAMRVLAGRGSLQAGSRVYEAYRRALRADYGIEPDAGTRDLARSLGCSSSEAGAALPEPTDAAAPRLRFAGASAAPAELAPARAKGCPRIMILPPMTILKDEETLRLAQAFIEDVTVGLSRYRSFAIIAPHTARTMAQDVSKSAVFAARGGADFVVTTALKPTLAGLAMTFRLTELADDAVVSVSEIDWHPDDLTQVFSHLVRKVVHALVDAIEKTTLLLPAGSPDASAYRLYLEGRQSLASIDLPNLRRAKRWFRDAAGRAHLYAAPLVGLARATIMEWFVVGMPDDTSLTDALRFADRGLALDPLDWRGLREKALANLWLRRHEQCLALFEEALLLGPNDADLIADYADALAHCGQPERGLELHEKAMNLNPLHPDYYIWIKGSILFQTHRYEAALETMQPIKANPALSRLLAACSARAGFMKEAHGYARTLREVYPDFRSESLWRVSPNFRAEDTSHFVDSLRLAGVD